MKRRVGVSATSAREALTGVAFVLPALVVFGTFVFYPFGRNIWLGFRRSNPFTGESSWVGWSQWTDRLQLVEARGALVRAAGFAVVVAFIAVGSRVGLRARARQGNIVRLRVEAMFALRCLVVVFVPLAVWLYSAESTGPKDFAHALRVTLLLTIYTVPISILIGLGLAVLLRDRLRGVPIFRLAYAIPIVAGPGVAGALFSKLFNPRVGFIPWLLDKEEGIIALGDFSVSPLRNPDWALLAVAVVLIWMNLGLSFVLMSAGLASVPDELYEAAEVDGAGRRAQFWRVTLPMLSPTIFTAFLLGTIIAMVQSVGVIEVLTGGGPHPYETTTTIPVLILHLVRGESANFNLAGIYSVALFVLTFSLTLLQLRVAERWVRYER